MVLILKLLVLLGDRGIGDGGHREYTTRLARAFMMVVTSLRGCAIYLSYSLPPTAIMHDDLFVTLDYYGFSQFICMSQHLLNTSVLILPPQYPIPAAAIFSDNSTIEAKHKVHVSEVFPIIDHSTGPLRQTISKGNH
ncbi:uncharacterized protein ARMOST_02926 [Armillaria ostoyae]|uniref:Uncharacterized protein n=1 Tax=Armillaria ostoyae TaxID=47428 RepID=A0A284QT10_ARMOS|nr:uncharacterized protein ARMOST_02926 [Armillaria ostoyae]